MIKYFKLHNGREMIGEVPDDRTEYDVRVVKHPWWMLITNQGYVSQPIPVKEITLDNHHILMEGEADDSLASTYRQAHGGIVKPPQGLSMPN